MEAEQPGKYHATQVQLFSSIHRNDGSLFTTGARVQVEDSDYPEAVWLFAISGSFNHYKLHAVVGVPKQGSDGNMVDVVIVAGRDHATATLKLPDRGEKRPLILVRPQVDGLVANAKRKLAPLLVEHHGKQGLDTLGFTQFGAGAAPAKNYFGDAALAQELRDADMNFSTPIRRFTRQRDQEPVSTKKGLGAGKKVVGKKKKLKPAASEDEEFEEEGTDEGDDDLGELEELTREQLYTRVLGLEEEVRVASDKLSKRGPSGLSGRCRRGACKEGRSDLKQANLELKELKKRKPPCESCSLSAPARKKQKTKLDEHEGLVQETTQLRAQTLALTNDLRSSENRTEDLDRQATALKGERDSANERCRQESALPPPAPTGSLTAEQFAEWSKIAHQNQPRAQGVTVEQVIQLFAQQRPSPPAPVPLAAEPVPLAAEPTGEQTFTVSAFKEIGTMFKSLR